jgi:predicted amidophosphoribosyltransferase
LFARILDAAARIKEHRDQVRKKTCDIHKRAAKCIEVEGGLCENLLYIDDVLTHYKFGNNFFPSIFNIHNADVNVS